MADHERHDQEVVAAAADRGGRAAGVVAACNDCLTLLSDLRALAVAMPWSAIPGRPRDYRLTMEDAARLRRRGWRRIVAALGSGRDAVTRPLALSLTTLGLIGLLLGSMPAAMPFAAGTARDQAEIAQPVGAPDANDAPGTVTTTDRPVGDAISDASGAQDAAARPAPEADASALRILALSFLGLGLGTFVVRRVASTRRGVR